MTDSELLEAIHTQLAETDAKITWCVQQILSMTQMANTMASSKLFSLAGGGKSGNRAS